MRLIGTIYFYELFCGVIFWSVRFATVLRTRKPRPLAAALLVATLRPGERKI